MPKQIEIPQEIYSSDKACAEFIVRINEQLGKLSDWEKMLKTAKATAEEHLLSRMDAEGAKHFAFDGVGTFARRQSVKCSFPTEEAGGREAAGAWLDRLLADSIITTQHVLYAQQARLVPDSVLAVERLACEHNWKVLLNAALISADELNKQQQQLDDGVTTYDQILNQQQAFATRVQELNVHRVLAGQPELHLIAASPFGHFVETKLSAPRKSA
uniref:Uncharacterized protein n=1 Tax=Podoviridae sp. ctnCN2 TaxID=2825274 RepID=A0A8S5PMC4_9CAUD|nr:MAG TPA: hypothetical protein [Podoviridae sp. ctnCN2]